MDPGRPDCRRSPLARSPTLRPDPRHQRVEDTNNDAVIKLIRDTQRSGPPDTGFHGIQGSRSPIACKRKTVLPAIGSSLAVHESDNDKVDNEPFYRNHSRLYVHPPTIVEPNSASRSNNEISDIARPSESDEASPSTPTADSGFADKELDTFNDPNESVGTSVRNSNREKSFNEFDNIHEQPSHMFNNETYNEHPRPSSNGRAAYDLDLDFEDSEFSHELQRSSRKTKTKSRLEVGRTDAGGRSRSRMASRNSVSIFDDDDEPRFGDDSMLKPVSHQSVVAEDKLVSSRCRRSSKLLDKLMLSEYNSGQTTSILFPLHNSISGSSSTTHKGYQSKSFRSLSNTLTMAGHIIRPRNLPHLPAILKRQRTVDIPDEGEHHQSLGYERPCAPSPSLTPPSPSASDGTDCDEEHHEDDSNIDYIDCR